MGNANQSGIKNQEIGKMKAAIYNPYLDTLGGGERYTIVFARSLCSLGYSVDIEWNDESIQKKIEERFGIHITDMRFVDDIKRGDGYDVCFWVSDGSIPILRARRNFLHFQVPFKNINGKSLMNKMKFMRINRVICNSYFTKDVIDNEYGVDSYVLYPPVAVHEFKPLKKQNIILYVGRFSQLEQSKNQHILVEVFRELYVSGAKQWKLVLAGGTDIGVGDYIEKLRERMDNFPIEIIENPSFEELKDLYGKSRVFWTASGFSIDDVENPRKAEHFGISLVEAMSAENVVFAFEGGGHKEIIAEGENGFLWKSEDELLKKTLALLEDTKNMKEIGRRARIASKVYEQERFEAQVAELVVNKPREDGILSPLR